MTTGFSFFRRFTAVIILISAVVSTCLSADFASLFDHKKQKIHQIRLYSRQEKAMPAMKPVQAAAHKNDYRKAKPAMASASKHKPAPAPKPRKYVRVVATGYTAGLESTGKKPGHPLYGITYSGVKVRRSKVSTIAADPDIFPIGTLLYVPGYGYGIVADTGSAIKGKKIDLYFETKKQVFTQWGKRTVDVQMIKRGEGKLSEAWIDKLNEVAAAGKSIPESLLKS